MTYKGERSEERPIAYVCKTRSLDFRTTSSDEIRSHSMDLETFCVCSDHKESDSSYTNIVQPFLYGPEASESSNSSWSDFDEESSCSGDESSARIGNTDLYGYFVLLHLL